MEVGVFYRKEFFEMKKLNPTHVVLALSALVIFVTVTLCACGINNSDSVPIETTTTSVESSTVAPSESDTVASAEFNTTVPTVASFPVYADHKNVVCYSPASGKFDLSKMSFACAEYNGIVEVVLFGIEAPIEDLNVEGWKVVSSEVLAPKAYKLTLDTFAERNESGFISILDATITLYGETIVELVDGTAY